jgi:hypothetical protein
VPFSLEREKRVEERVDRNCDFTNRVLSAAGFWIMRGMKEPPLTRALGITVVAILLAPILFDIPAPTRTCPPEQLTRTARWQMQQVQRGDPTWSRRIE